MTATLEVSAPVMTEKLQIGYEIVTKPARVSRQTLRNLWPGRRQRLPLSELSWSEQLNFLITNRIPRRLLTRLMGWFSRIESRRLTRASIWIWRQFADDLRLYEAADADFASLQQCFTRSLRPGARAICNAADVLVSPCDGVVGAFGDVKVTQVFQAKGFPYLLDELLLDPAMAARYQDGRFLTLRLKSSMYHRFHAPCDAEIRGIRYISGDTWNVNPVALKKVQKLFCRNERAVIALHTADPDEVVTLVPVAAILVASIRIHCLPGALNLQYAGPNEIVCESHYTRGEELGYFEHGSTIIILTSGRFRFRDTLTTGDTVRMGEAVMEKNLILD